MFPLGLTVTVERPTGTDRHGNALPPDEHDLPGCALAPGGSSEQIVDSAQVTWDVDLLTTDPVADVSAVDAVVVPSGPYAGRYAVHGFPKFYRNPWTGRGGTLVLLRGVRG